MHFCLLPSVPLLSLHLHHVRPGLLQIVLRLRVALQVRVPEGEGDVANDAQRVAAAAVPEVAAPRCTRVGDVATARAAHRVGLVVQPRTLLECAEAAGEREMARSLDLDEVLVAGRRMDKGGTTPGRILA